MTTKSITRPTIVGLHNPHSADPEMALDPSVASGRRLWKMLDAFDPPAARVYRHAFSRRNLCPTAKETRSHSAMRRLAAEMVKEFVPGSIVVLLGDEVRLAFSRVLSEPIEKRLPIHPQVIDGVAWRVLPHPSGRTLAYNDPVFRSLAGMLLSDLTRE